MLGYQDTCSPVPWFWSDQYDMAIQISDLAALSKSAIVRETGTGSRIFFALGADSVLVGVGQLGEIAKDVRMAQELVARRVCVGPTQLAERTD